MRFDKNRFGATSLTLICLMGNAMAQSEKPPSNKMGDIISNQGIVTQGQVGNNTIVNPVHRDANGVYQGNTKVGSAQPPAVDAATGIATFRAMHFTAYPDPSQPLEYGDLLLSADTAPQPPPNTFVGTFSAMIAGFQARIIGKR
jgi:hypothetical protein